MCTYKEQCGSMKEEFLCGAFFIYLNLSKEQKTLICNINLLQLIDKYYVQGWCKDEFV